MRAHLAAIVGIAGSTPIRTGKCAGEIMRTAMLEHFGHDVSCLSGYSSESNL